MIATRWQWLLRQFSRGLYFRAGVIAALSVAAAFAAILLKPFIPEKLAMQIGADSVDSILTIIASSMLAVTTFSLSTVVSAYASAASTATPRAIGLMQQDTAAQNMLATFVGAFVYSLVGIVFLITGVYGDSGRLVLFAVTIAVIALLIATLLRWIDFLLRFGRLGEVISRMEDAAVAALEAQRANPWLGGKPLAEDWKPDPGMNVVSAQKVGCVQHVDMAQLQEAAGEKHGIFLAALPGALVHPGRPLAWYDGAGDEDVSRHVATAFSFGSERSYDQDPRFGVIVSPKLRPARCRLR